jgi:hypothetical protein
MMRNRKLSPSRQRARWSAIAAALGPVLLAGLLTAAPARADGAFERGFENELGRILAHETVHLGRHVLFHGAAPYAVHAVRVEPHPHVLPPRRHGHWQPELARLERRHARHHRHHRRHRDCRGH